MRHLTATLCLGALAAAASSSFAQTPASAPVDVDALSLADEPVQAPQAAQSWRFFAEAAASRGTLFGVPSKVTGGRVAFDMRYDSTFAPGWRVVLSDRLDVARHSEDVLDYNVNTVREAYLSWHVTPTEILDMGRVNLRFGSAYGYNPTDFFKAGALRSITSPDPANLRENRQGSFVLQGQKLWSTTSVSLVLSPRLDRTPSDSTFALNEGATNPSNRWLLAGSHKFSPNFEPQIVLHGGEDTPLQYGVNLTGLLGNATVAYAELAGGEGPSLISRTLSDGAPERIQRRAALGLTYTTAFNLSVTGEVEYNSAGADRGEWATFTAAAPGNALRLLQTAQYQQDLPVRRAAFVHALWRDVGIKGLDISGFVRREAETRSREQWIEARYHWNKAEVALQWQSFNGAPSSVFGAVPQPRRLELLLRVFL